MPQKANAGAGAPHPVGRGNHTVVAGECFHSIAAATGHFWETLWEHPQNRDVRLKRGSPHVLLPGDSVFVPPIEPKQIHAATDSLHRFVLKGIPIDFELKILNANKPRAGVPYTISIEDRLAEGKVPEDGILRLRIKPSDRTGWLVLRPSGREEEKYTLDFGHLDPAHSPSGAKARLRNMGFLSSDDSEEVFAEALECFQQWLSLPVTGTLDDETAKRLTEEHGS